MGWLPGHAPSRSVVTMINGSNAHYRFGLGLAYIVTWPLPNLPSLLKSQGCREALNCGLAECGDRQSRDPAGNRWQSSLR